MIETTPNSDSSAKSRGDGVTHCNGASDGAKQQRAADLPGDQHAYSMSRAAGA